MNDFSLAVGTNERLRAAQARQADVVLRKAGRLVRVLRGREQVMAQAGLLRTLATQTGQEGALHWLEYNVSLPSAEKKIPALVLVGAEGADRFGEITAGNIAGAVVLFEYAIAGCGLRVFAGDDTTGYRSVIAPVELRAAVARTACVELIKGSGLGVLVTCEGVTEEAASRAIQRRNGATIRIGMRGRSVPRYLPLCQTHEATLAQLGRHTRRNLRYYRRRLETEIGVEFVPAATLTLHEFLAMNRASINPSPNDLARWRYAAMERTPGTMIAGMRTTKGRWLSLIGGRRHGELTEIDWQINVAGLPRYSLSTAMRSYMLEHEVALGMRRLAFNGGTTHSIRHSFVSVDAVDIVAVREGAAGWLFSRIAAWTFPRKNFLRDALQDKGVMWMTDSAHRLESRGAIANG